MSSGSPFASFVDFIKTPVGNGLDNDARDIRVTKDHLKKLGFFDDETDNDFITRTMDDGIRNFQKKEGLKVDGLMKPGGETERTIFKNLEKRDPDLYFQGIAPDKPEASTIGFGQNVFGTLVADRQAVNNINEKTPVPKPDIAKKYTEKQKEFIKKELDSFEKDAMPQSKKAFEHYAYGDGGRITMSSKEMEASKRLQDAMAKNRKMFEQSITQQIVDNRDNPLYHQIVNLKDGEKVDLSRNKQYLPADEVWDRDIKANKFLVKFRSIDPDPDQTNSTGSVKLRSLGNMTAERKGDTVIIKGNIDHTLIDRYDFNQDGISDRLAFRKHAELASNGEAKTFFQTGVKSEKISALVRINNGKIMSSIIDWEK